MSGIDDQIALFDLDPEPEEPPAEPSASEEPPSETPDMSAEDPSPTDADTVPSDTGVAASADQRDELPVQPRPWESLPVTEDADGHAIIVTAEATYTPSGARLTGPVDTIEKLDKLLHWAALTPPHGLTARCGSSVSTPVPSWVGPSTPVAKTMSTTSNNSVSAPRPN